MGEAVQNLKKKAAKPKYGIWSNVCYMTERAFQTTKSVLGYASLEVLGFIGINLLELYMPPVLLNQLEAKVPLGTLLGTIAAFALTLVTLHALMEYVKGNTFYGRSKLRMEIGYDVYEKLCSTSYCRLDNPEFSEEEQKCRIMVGGSANSPQAVWDTLVKLSQSIFGLVIYLVLLASLDPVILIVTTVTTVAGYLFGKRINGWGYRHKKEQQEYVHRLQYIDDHASDRQFAKDIRLFGMQEWLRELHDKWYGMLADFYAREQKVYLMGDILDLFLTVLRNGIAYWYLLHMTLRDGLSASAFLLYFSAVGGFTNWVVTIMGKMTELYRNSLDISIVREFIGAEETFRFEGGRPLEKNPNGSYTLELRDVTYRYLGAEKDTLSHVNLTLHPGEKLAIVGINGAGKTTLVKLMCGFYDPTEGQVLLNGIDIREYNRAEYYKMFAAVFQEYCVLDATIEENITQDVGEPDKERISECLDLAGLTELIEKLPEGTQTHIGKKISYEGIELSGGQTQRLMLARALYKDAPLLVLDEPTAALDPIAEDDIYQKYNRLSENKSSLFISHRLASTRFCDRIILMENGRIEEEGTHESLLKLGGKYAQLFEVQKKYYEEEGAEHE